MKRVGKRGICVSRWPSSSISPGGDKAAASASAAVLIGPSVNTGACAGVPNAVPGPGLTRPSATPGAGLERPVARPRLGPGLLRPVDSDAGLLRLTLRLALPNKPARLGGCVVAVGVGLTLPIESRQAPAASTPSGELRLDLSAPPGEPRPFAASAAASGGGSSIESVSKCGPSWLERLEALEADVAAEEVESAEVRGCAEAWGREAERGWRLLKVGNGRAGGGCGLAREG